MEYDFMVLAPILIAFGISVVLSPVMIPFLKKLKFGQFVRDDGPESHLKKSGTPTMGGLIILCSIVVTSLFYMKSNPVILPVLFVTLGFGLVGFFHGASRMAEDGGAVRSHGDFCLLSG